MTKNLTFKLMGLLLFPVFCYAQVNPRMVNRKYAQTIYLEDFSSNQTFKNDWTANFVTKDNSLYSFVDTSATVNLDEITGELKLSMLNIPGGYTNTYWGSTFITNFISGEMISSDYFGYGVYQCKAKFAYNKGSFPAFWLYNDSDCHVSKRNEIDIVECKVDDSSTTLDNHMFYYPTNCGASLGYGFKGHQFNSWGQSHVFECVYAPNRIEFWVDDSLYHTVTNNGDYRFPDQMMRLILSQQVVRYNGGQNEIVAPQTSTFYWVKAKEFFLAPEITCPSLICASGTAVMDVAQSADSITWSLTPTNLFSGTKQGAGKTANINAAGPRGQGKITYTFKMPSNEIFTAEKTFYIGDSGFTPIVDGESTVTCDNALFTEANRKSVYWSVYGPLEIVGQNFGYRCTIKGTGNGYGWVYATNDCGSQRGELFVEVDCGYFLTLTPNPSAGETTVAIESSSKELIVDENEEWEMEVYSDFQSLKKKDSKLLGKYQKLQTNGWKEGVYVVRVKYKDIILQEKLLVK